MTTIIISDIHLTSFFIQAKYDHLEKIFKSADKIILNGDFWDAYLCTFTDFINSDWKKLFPLLKSKKAVYLYGNHDPQSKSDKRVNLFSIQNGDSYRFSDHKNHFYVTHGHKQAPSVDQRFPRLFAHRLLLQIYAFVTLIGLRLFADKYYLKDKKDNEKMKRWKQKNLKSNEILICGHTHIAEVDTDIGFINSGFNNYGYSQYLKIEKGNFKLIKTRY